MFKKFEPKETLTEKETERSLRCLLRDGILSQSMVSLAGGPILIAFALELGADKTFVGLIVALSFFAGLIQIPSTYLVEKIARRKLIVLTSSTLARMFVLLLAAIPLLAAQNSLRFLFLFLALHYALSNISVAAWNPWMRDLVPMKNRGAFFSKRMQLSLTFALVLSIGGGLFLDYWGEVRGSLLGFSLIFALAFLFGMMSNYYVSKMEEPRMQITGFSYGVLLSPYRDVNFKRLIYFLAMWGFTTHMVIPFIMVYMLSVLGMSLTLVMTLTVVGQLSSIFWLKFSGRISDKYGNKPVMVLSGGAFVLGTLLLSLFILLEPKVITLLLLLILHLLLGIATAGINLTSANIAAKLSPVGVAPIYLASIGTTFALFSGLGALVAGGILDFVGYGPYFLITSLLILFSLYFIVHVKEKGEAPTRIVEKELMYLIKRNLSNLSTIKEAYRLTPRLLHLPKLKRKR